MYNVVLNYVRNYAPIISVRIHCTTFAYYEEEEEEKRHTINRDAKQWLDCAIQVWSNGVRCADRIPT